MSANHIIETENNQNALEQIAAQVLGEDRRLAALIRNKNWDNDVKVEAIERPKTWRLISTNNGDGGTEELVFTVYGFLQDKSLPPLNTKPRTAPNRYRFLKQGVTIAGLNTPTFNDSLKSATEIYGLFDRCFAEGTMESWSCAEEMSNAGDLFHASNRYLTPKAEAAGAGHQPFKKLVDPKGILEAMATEGYVHTEDNDVLYSKRRVCPDGKYSYDEIGPQAFRIGDIVEIQVSFVVVPLKEEKVKMITVLRSLTLLEIRTKEVQPQPKSNIITLKRRVGHRDEKEQQAKRNEMLIDGVD